MRPGLLFYEAHIRLHLERIADERAPQKQCDSASRTGRGKPRPYESAATKTAADERDCPLGWPAIPKQIHE